MNLDFEINRIFEEFIIYIFITSLFHLFVQNSIYALSLCKIKANTRKRSQFRVMKKSSSISMHSISIAALQCISIIFL